jgi:hypothetical protein
MRPLCVGEIASDWRREPLNGIKRFLALGMVLRAVPIDETCMLKLPETTGYLDVIDQDWCVFTKSNFRTSTKIWVSPSQSAPPARRVQDATSPGQTIPNGPHLPSDLVERTVRCSSRHKENCFGGDPSARNRYELRRRYTPFRTSTGSKADARRAEM